MAAPPNGVSRVNLCPEFRCPTRPTSSALEKYLPFSLSFQGLVKPDVAGTYTFSAEVENADDRVRLWLSNSLVIDNWSSLSSLTPSATFGFQSDSALEDIRIEYKTTETCVYPYLCYDLKLKWQSSATSGSRVEIPSGNLFQRINFSSVPVSLFIAPSTSEVQMCEASGASLSLVTAGVAAQFTVLVRVLVCLRARARALLDTFLHLYASAVVICIHKIEACGGERRLLCSRRANLRCSRVN